MSNPLVRRPGRAAFVASLLGASLAVWAEAATSPASVTATPHPAPVVVELFQSQGCSSCPPAQRHLNELAARPDVLALSFAVTYWDDLGWKDIFGQPAFTERQRDYSAANHNAGVATPQYWINGRATVLGEDPARVEQAVAAGGPRGGPDVAIDGTEVRVGAGHAPAGGADVWLVRYDPRTIPVAIQAGENDGRTIPHRDIVRELTRLGRWTGEPLALRLPAGPEGLKLAVLVQAGRGGAILAAVKA